MNFKKIIIFLVISIFVTSSSLNAIGSQLQTEKNNAFKTTDFATKTIELEF